MTSIYIAMSYYIKYDTIVKRIVKTGVALN